MNVALVFIAAIAILFALAYVTKRRFGVLGLALAAGAMLSSLWAERLTPVIADAGIKVEAPPLLTLVSVGLVLLPAVFLLFGGPSYKEKIPRLVGAVLFAALAMALLIQPLGSALVLEGQSKMVYDTLEANRVYIVTAGLIFAVLDLLLARTAKEHKSAKH